MNSIIRLSFITFLSFTGSVFAQGFHLGVKGGLNLNRSSGFNFDDKRTFGYNFGGYIYYDFTKNIGLQIEGLYGRSGLRFNERSQNQEDGISEGKKRINQLSVPVLAKINVGDLFSVVGGPQFSSVRNTDDLRLNNGIKAFESKVGVSYTAGIDFGILYFRYVWGNNQFKNSVDNDFANQQYQFGFRVTLL